MFSVINFVEFEHQIVSATYRHLMVGATVVLVDNENGEALPEPVARIVSPAPNGSVRLRLPPSVKPGTYCLRAINGHGECIAQSLSFRVGRLPDFRDFR